MITKLVVKLKLYFLKKKCVIVKKIFKFIILLKFVKNKTNGELKKNQKYFTEFIVFKKNKKI